MSKQQQRVLLTSTVPKGTAVYLSQTYFLVIVPKGCGLPNFEMDTSPWRGWQTVSQILSLLRIAEESKSLACPITVREHRVRSSLKPFSQVCDHCSVPSAAW